MNYYKFNEPYHGGNKMTYNKFNEPYYALIRAKTKDKAMKMYTQYIAEYDGGNLNDEVEQVSFADAILECIKAIEKTNDTTFSLQNGICGEEISNTLNNSKECILLLDGSLQ